jgi:hypothetical protein
MENGLGDIGDTDLSVDEHLCAAHCCRHMLSATDEPAAAMNCAEYNLVFQVLEDIRSRCKAQDVMGSTSAATDTADVLDRVDHLETAIKKYKGHLALAANQWQARGIFFGHADKLTAFAIGDYMQNFLAQRCRKTATARLDTACMAWSSSFVASNPKWRLK